MSQILVLGSGLGGLSCGVQLARMGHQITVLEQSPQAGGCLQSFYRHGHRWETGMHFVGSYEEGQVLHPMLQDYDLHLPLVPLDAGGYEQIHLEGQSFAYAKGDAFVDVLAQHFPQERDNLWRYLQLVRKIMHVSSIHHETNLTEQLHTMQEYQSRSVDTILESMIGDATLRQVLVGNLPLYAGRKGQTPFATHAFITEFYNASAARIAGGSQIIAEQLIQQLEQLGGKVLTRQRVTEIHCNHSQATGVTTAKGAHFPADCIVSTLHPQALLSLLPDTPLLRPAYKRRIDALPNTVGCFTLYLAFRPESLPYLNANQYVYHTSPWDCEYYTTDDWPRGFLYMHQCEKPHQQWATTAEVIAYVRYEEMKPWEDSFVGHRGSSYEMWKAARTEQLLAALERQFPGTRACISRVYSSSPLTYRDYTGTVEGSLYGIARDISLGAAGRVATRTRIPNLFLAGQNVNSHGILGTLVGTHLAVSEIKRSWD